MNERDYFFFEILCIFIGTIYFFLCSFLFIVFNLFTFINIFNLFSVFLFFFILFLYFHFKRIVFINKMLVLVEKIKNKPPEVKVIDPRIRIYRNFNDFKYKTFEVYVTENKIIISGILKKTNNFSPYIMVYDRGER